MPEGLLPPGVSLAVDVRVAAFCAGAALLVGVLFGLAPAWQAPALSRRRRRLAGDSRTATRGGGRLRNLLVAGQVARRCAAGRRRPAAAHAAGRRGRRSRLRRRERADDDRRPAGVGVPDRREAAAVLRRASSSEVRALPGVRGVAWATTLPLGESYEGDVRSSIAGTPPPADEPAARGGLPDRQRRATSRRWTCRSSPGRPFDERDIAGGAPVCIVNEAFVRAAPAGPVADRRARVDRDSGRAAAPPGRARSSAWRGR